MDLTYFLKLGEEEIIELINNCIEYENKILNLKIPKPFINRVKVYIEEDRKDLGNKRYVLIYANSQAYMATDYSLKTFDSATCPEIDFSNILYTFMTKRFDEDYINSLYDVKLQELEKMKMQLRENMKENKRSLAK